MTRITGEIVIGTPADVVFDFVADQRNEPACNLPVSGSAAGAALLACWQQRPGVARVAAAAAAATSAVHAVREAIYLSPGHGSEVAAAH